MSQFQKPRILIVEDNEGVAKKFMRSLDEIGEIRIARNTKDVLLQVSDFTPQLVLLDLVLEGEGEEEPWQAGMSILRKIRASAATMSVIVITGRIEPETEAECRRLGVFEFLQKPVSIEGLRRLTRQAVAQVKKPLP